MGRSVSLRTPPLACWPAHISSPSFMFLYVYLAATAVLAIAHLAGGLVWVIGFALAVLLIGMWLDQHVAVPFAVASKS